MQPCNTSFFFNSHKQDTDIFLTAKMEEERGFSVRTPGVEPGNFDFKPQANHDGTITNRKKTGHVLFHVLFSTSRLSLVENEGE